MDVNQAKSLGLDELKRRKAEMDNDINRDPSLYTIIGNAISELEYEEAQEQERSNREQKQNATIEAIDEMELPRDFDADLGQNGINNIIRYLLKEQSNLLFMQHNAEIEDLHTSYRDKLKSADDKEEMYKRQYADLQKDYEAAANDANKVRLEMIQLQQEKEDAEQKRDAAVRELEQAQQEIKGLKAEVERLNSQVSDLQTEKALGAREAVKVIENSPTLENLVQEAKASLSLSVDEKYNRFMERNKEYMKDITPPSLEVITASQNVEPTLPEQNGGDSFRSEGEGTHSADAQDSGIHPPKVDEVSSFPESGVDLQHEEQPAVPESGGQVTREEFEALKTDVEVLKRRAGMIV